MAPMNLSKGLLFLALMVSPALLFAQGVNLTSQPPLRVSVGGTLAVKDASYFGDTVHDAVANSATFPAAEYPGQALMTFDPTVGGFSAGQLYYAGADGRWRRDFQFGRVTIYETDGTAQEGLLVKVTNGVDNCITVLNESDTNYDATRFVDSERNERGAVGHGNRLAKAYRSLNFLEDFNTLAGFYFVTQGSVIGGMDATNLDLAWYMGTSTNPAAPLQGLTNIFRVNHTNGTVTVPFNLVVGNLTANNPLGTPTNATTPAAFEKATNNGVLYYRPLYQ